MSTKVASLFAEITADTSGFQKASRGVKKELTEQERALQAFSRQATLEAKSFAAIERQKQQALAKTNREAAKAARDSARAQQQAHTAIRNGVLGTIGALTTVSAVAVQAYNSYQNYAGSVRDVAIASGQGAREASILIQTLDDFEISADDAQVAARALKEKGLSPTVDTLAMLSDQFKAIKDPAKALEFAQDNLGRSYRAYLNLLDQGGDVIRETSQDVNQNLILTDQQIEQSEEIRLAVDKYTDAIEGAKVQTGAFFGRMLLYTENTKALKEEYKELTGITIGPGRGVNADFERFSKSMERGALMTQFYTQQQAALGDTIENTLAQQQEAEVRAGQALEGGMQLTNMSEKYADTLAALNEKLEEEKGKLQDLNEMGYKPNSETLQQQIDVVNELQDAVTRANEQQVNSQEEYALSLLRSKEATNQQMLDFAVASGQITQDAANQEMAQQKIADAFLDGTITAEKYVEILAQLTGMLEGLDGFEANIMVNMAIGGMPPALSGNSLGGAGAVGGSNASGSGNTVQAAAGGGQLGGHWALVGDTPGGGLTPWSELISPSGYVFDAKTTRKLMASGMIGRPESHANANDDDGGMFSNSTVISGSSSSHQWRATRQERPEQQGNVEGVNVMEMTAEVSRVQVDMQKEIQRAVTASMNAFNDRVDELISVMAVENPRAIAKGVSFELKRITG